MVSLPVQGEHIAKRIHKAKSGLSVSLFLSIGLSVGFGLILLTSQSLHAQQATAQLKKG